MQRFVASFLDSVLTWKDARGYVLSERIWGNRRRTLLAIDQVLRDGIARGDSVGTIATSLEAYVRPEAGGTAEYAALRLASNETRRAHTLAMIDVAEHDPRQRKLNYRTSLFHPRPDECDAHRAGSPYTPKQCPQPPVHIGCLCFLEWVSGPITQADIDAARTPGSDVRRRVGEILHDARVMEQTVRADVVEVTTGRMRRFVSAARALFGRR